MSWLQAATLIVSAFTIALTALSIVISIHLRRVRRARREQGNR